jgi:hypothetical protein
MTVASPTREIVDDYMGIVDAGLCAWSCGAARNEKCICRCGGEFHNLMQDWWSSAEYLSTALWWCVTCQRHYQGEPLTQNLRHDGPHPASAVASG